MRMFTLFAIAAVLLTLVVPAQAADTAEAVRTEFSWFADYVVQGGRARSTNPGGTFSQMELDITHRFNDWFDLEVALPYSQADHEGAITLFMLRAQLWGRDRYRAELLLGQSDVPIGIDYHRYAPTDGWLFTRPLTNTTTFDSWNDFGGQLNLFHGNFRLKLIQFTGAARGSSPKNMQARGFRYEYFPKSSPESLAGISYIRDESDGRSQRTAFLNWVWPSEWNLRCELHEDEHWQSGIGQRRAGYLQVNFPIRKGRWYGMIRRGSSKDSWNLDTDGNEGLDTRRWTAGVRHVLRENQELRLEWLREREISSVTRTRDDRGAVTLQYVISGDL